MKRRILIILILITLMLQAINPGSLGFAVVNAAEAASPDFTITRSIDKTEFHQGDTAQIVYSITPTGQLQAPVQSHSDIVIAMDLSTGMAGSKLSASKNAAIELIDKIKAADAGTKIGFVSFGYKVNKTIALTEDLDSISSYISSLKDSNLMSGSNFQDALEKSRALINQGTAQEKYIVFISDGEPNYFTSSYRIKKFENQYAVKEDGVYYYTNFPQKTQKAYDKAMTACNQLASDGTVLYSLGIGSKDDVDINFLSKMALATGGSAYQAELPDTVVQILTQISDSILSAKLSGLVIHDKVPEGISIVDNEAVIMDSEGSISIVLPDIVYKSDGTTPAPFNYVLEVVLNNAGSYTLNNASINYLDIDSAVRIKSINSISFIINAVSGTPGLKISKEISKTELMEGEAATLSYTITPTGSFDEEADRQPIDIVLLMDKSNGMEDNGKLTAALAAAESFVNIFKEAGQGDRISLVTFNRYSQIEVPLTTDYESVLSTIGELQTDDGYSFDSGTNIEIGLKAAENALQGSTNQRYVIMLSDGVPSFYTDTIDKNTYVDYYQYISERYYEGYWISSVKYQKWYKEPSNVIFEGDSMLDYNLAFGEYSYSQGSGDRGYADARAQAGSMGSKGIVLNTVCVTEDSDIDPVFMEELALLGKGTAYTSETTDTLYEVFNNLAKELSQQTLSNIRITEALPEYIEIVADESIKVNGRTVTIEIPDIVFEKGKGTPSPVTVSLQLRFNQEGIYELSEVSKLEYTDWTGVEAASVNMVKLTVTVSKGQGEAINAEIRAFDGDHDVTVISKGKFDAVISFEIQKAGKLNLQICTSAGSEELFANLSTASQISDGYGNVYKITKTEEGFFLTTDKPLTMGSYTVKIKFSIGSIPQRSYYLQMGSGTVPQEQRLRIDVVPMPILL